MKVLRETSFLALAVLVAIVQLGCGDQYRPVANPVVSPGGQPQTLHFAWVVNFNANGPGTTTEIDVSGDTNLGVNNMGQGSIAEAFPPNSFALFVANRENDTVSEYLPVLTTIPLTTITLPAGARPVSVNSGQPGFMYVVNSGGNSGCPNNGGSLSVIPILTLSVSNTLCVGANPTAMAQSPVNFYAYVLNQGDGTVSVINGVGPSLAGTIPAPQLQGQSCPAQNPALGPNPVSITASPNGSWIFIVTQGDDVTPPALDIVGSGNTAVAACVPLGARPTFSVVDPILNRLYVANSGDNTVSVFDASNVNPSGSNPIPLLATVPVGTNPIGITPLVDSSNFYVANAGSNDVTVVSANSFSPLATVPLPAGANPVFIASDPTSSKVYVADQGTSATTIIKTSNNTVAGNISAPQQVSTCSPQPNLPCALQQPVMIVTQ